MTHWVNKMNWYATREMQDYLNIFSLETQIKIKSQKIKQ